MRRMHSPAASRPMLRMAACLVAILSVMVSPGSAVAVAHRRALSSSINISSVAVVDIGDATGDGTRSIELSSLGPATSAALGGNGTTRRLLQGCSDMYSNCVSWAQQGYCASQYVYNGQSVQNVVCKASCKTCNNGGTACTDRNNNCASWANQGYCAPQYVYQGQSVRDVLCRKSCQASGCSSGGGSDYRSQILAMVNKERTARGMAPVCLNAKLNAASQAQSDSGVYAHTFDHITRQGYKWNALGQNIARGQGSAQQVFSDWFNEVPPNDGHRKNILNPGYNQMGVGWTQSSNMWTQNFGKSSSEPCQ